jgi:nitrate reductase NapA
MRTFGIDEPMGCYDDIEAADAFVLWGSNMAEMHPVLWTRVTDRAPERAETKVAVLSPFEHRSSSWPTSTHLHAADRPGDPELHRAPHHQDQPREPRLRRQAHQLQARQRRHRLRAAARASAAEGGEERRRRRRLESRSRFDEIREVRLAYDLGSPSKLTGVPKATLEALAELYADPKVKVMSFWTMGFNQHTRGVWANNLVYNLHLLTGKISTPGNSPFSLTGQPSPAAPRARSAPSRTGCRPTWW